MCCCTCCTLVSVWYSTSLLLFKHSTAHAVRPHAYLTDGVPIVASSTYWYSRSPYSVQANPVAKAKRAVKKKHPYPRPMASPPFTVHGLCHWRSRARQLLSKAAGGGSLRSSHARGQYGKFTVRLVPLGAEVACCAMVRRTVQNGTSVCGLDERGRSYGTAQHNITQRTKVKMKDPPNTHQ